MVYSEYYFYTIIYNIINNKDIKLAKYQWKYQNSKNICDFILINKKNKRKKKVAIEIKYEKYMSKKKENKIKIKLLEDFNKIKGLSLYHHDRYIIVISSLKKDENIYNSIGEFRNYYKEKTKKFEDYIYERRFLSNNKEYVAVAINVI
jgi:hypothetical protein